MTPSSPRLRWWQFQSGRHAQEDRAPLLLDLVFDEFGDLVRQFAEGFVKFLFDAGEISGFGLGVLVEVFAQMEPVAIRPPVPSEEPERERCKESSVRVFVP